MIQISFPTESQAVAAYDAWVNTVDSRVSPTDHRRVTGVRRNERTVELDVEQYTAESLRARIAEIRWQRETGGVEVMPGVIFPTTRDVRADLSAELADAELIGPNYANTYVIGDIRIPVTLETLRAVNATVRAHVREAFAWQAALLARLDAGEDPNTIAAEITG